MQNRNILLSALVLIIIVLGAVWYARRPELSNGTATTGAVSTSTATSTATSTGNASGTPAASSSGQAPHSSGSGSTSGTVKVGTGPAKPLQPLIKSAAQPSLTTAVKFDPTFTASAKASLSATIDADREAVRKNVKSAEAWAKLATDLKDAGDYAQARAAFEYASYLAPNNASIAYALGELYQSYFKEYKAAWDAYFYATKKDPSFVQAWLARAELYSIPAAENVLHTGTQYAALTLKDALAANPGDLSILTALGAEYRRLGDTATARTYYNQALSVAKAKGFTDVVAEIQKQIDALK